MSYLRALYYLKHDSWLAMPLHSMAHLPPALPPGEVEHQWGGGGLQAPPHLTPGGHSAQVAPDKETSEVKNKLDISYNGRL